MEMDVLKSLSSLQFELDEAKHSLKGVDDNIKKIIGRDPSDLPSRLNKKKLYPAEDKGRAGLKMANRMRKISYETEAPMGKRRTTDSVFKRLSDQEDIHQDLQKQMISKVIVTSKEVPSREDALEAQKSDEKFRARNKRMFGALLGTLQKFQQEQTKLKSREEKRAQLEKKIEDHEIKEREEIKKERHELFLNRKQKQIEIKIIELKMLKIKEYTTWVECQKPRGNFILTKTDPHINYLPRRLNNTTQNLLMISKQNVQTIIEKRSLQMLEELKQVEDKIKRNFNSKYGVKCVKQNQETFSNETTDHNKHFEASNELVFEETDSGKEDTNVISEISTELYSFGKQYNSNSNQDKENKNLVANEESAVILPESDIKCNVDVNISEVI